VIRTALVKTTRRAFLAACAIVSLIVSAPSVSSPVHYEIDFTGGSPTPTSGSFDYDSAVPSFSNFNVVWNGLTFDLTEEANVGPGALTACPSITGAALSFALLAQAPCIAQDGSFEGYRWISTQFEDAPFRWLFLFEAFTDVPFNTLLRIDDVTPSEQVFATASGGWSISQTAVPEPPTIWLITLCLFGLVLVGRTRHGSQPYQQRDPLSGNASATRFVAIPRTAA
jgi:hypothetical protein